LLGIECLYFLFKVFLRIVDGIFIFFLSYSLSHYLLFLDHSPYDLDKWYESQVDLTNVCLAHYFETLVII